MGVVQLADTLAFLHDDATLVHCGISPQVTRCAACARPRVAHVLGSCGSCTVSHESEGALFPCAPQHLALSLCLWLPWMLKLRTAELRVNKDLEL